jgi:hypothetical protein
MRCWSFPPPPPLARRVGVVNRALHCQELIDKGVNAKAKIAVATALERSVNNMEPLISGSSTSFQVGSRVRITGLVEAKQHSSKKGTVCNVIEVGL